MKVILDTDRCQGHGRCYALAPDVFDCDDDGYARLRIIGDLPDDLVGLARTAADNCPEYAITVEP